MADVSKIMVGGQSRDIKDAESRRQLTVLDRLFNNSVDLTVKHAAEIVGYASPWAWIKARIQTAKYDDIHIGDYIPFVLTDGKTFKAEVAGIDTYYRYGDTPVGHHIDFITRDCHPDTHVWNRANFNNGLAATPNPWLCSDIYAWLNGLNIPVPTGTTNVPTDSVTTPAGYTSSGVLPLLPTALRDAIITKRALLPRRYTAGALLIDDNSWDWCDMGKLWLPSEVEVYGCTMWGTTLSPLQGHSGGGFVQYPIFAQNMKRIKGVGDGGDRSHWWLSSVRGGYSTRAAAVYYSGNAHGYSASYAYIRAPLCFRIA